MLAGLGLFVDLDWGRFLLWIPAIIAGGAGFAAFGAAIGGAAKEVRAASLLAFMISLPVAFLSLIPSGTVGARALRRDQRHHRALPVRSGAAGADRRPRRVRPEHRDRDRPPGDPRRSPTAAIARIAVRRFV